jgi:hypothetical protein
VVEQRPARRFEAEDEVLERRQALKELEPLLDHPDAVGERVVWTAEADQLVVELDLAFVRRDEPERNRHQRALAGPVLADERVNRAALDYEVDAVVRDDGAVALRDSAQREVRPTLDTVRAGPTFSLLAYLNQLG